MNRMKVTVIFRWECRTLEEHEVRVVGGCKELGNWNALEGHPLVRRKGTDIWTSSGVDLPLGQTIEYRYVTCKQGGEEVMCEEWEGNRRVKPTGRKHIIEDDNGAFRRPVFRKGSFDASELEPASPFQQELATIRAAEDSHQVRVTANDTVLFVCMMLPVSVERNPDTGKWSTRKTVFKNSLVLPFVHHFTKQDKCEQYAMKMMFVGLTNVHPESEADKREIRELLAPHNCLPVFPSEQDVRQHARFCTEFLWPVFHNAKIFDDADLVQKTSSGRLFDEAGWKSYQALCRTFAKVIEDIAKPEMIVWVHDYHLLLLPRYLYHHRQKLVCGLFLHCAFPSSEVLRCLPVRDEILKGMLSSRCVTFQIFDYLRNFLSCCSLLLGAKHTFHRGGVLQVEYDSRSIMVRSDHFVLPFQHLQRRLASEKGIVQRSEAIREAFAGKKIIVSVDRCDRFAGLTLKFRMFRRFLRECWVHRSHVVLRQYIEIPTVVSDSEVSTGASEAEEILEVLRKTAEETNKEFGTPGCPVIDLHLEGMDRDKRLEAIKAGDIILDTSINDGLNLAPFMFVAAHSADRRGVLVVSEFSGCSSALTGAFKVNPWNTDQVIQVLDKALQISPEEEVERFDKDHSYVSTMSLVAWATLNISEIKFAGMQTGNHQTSGWSACSGFMDTGFKCLKADDVMEDYKKAKTRCLFFDYEGTLSEKVQFYAKPNEAFATEGKVALKTHGMPPDTQLLDCLQVLTKDKRNTVVVLSGREHSLVDQWFGDVQGLGLCAEHGYFWTTPGSIQSRSDEPRWHSHTSVSGDDTDWKSLAKETMRLFVKRVQGSIIEAKGTAIKWYYSEVGASWVTSSLALELARFLNPEDPTGVMFGHPVKVVCGQGYVEVKRNDVDKGVAISRVIKRLREQGQHIDFVLCIGDDRSDEDMFPVVQAAWREQRCELTAIASDEVGTPTSFRSGALGGSLFSVKEEGKRSSFSRDNSEASLSKLSVTSGTKRTHSITNLMRSDEKFEVIDGEEVPQRHFYTVTVGRKPSTAQYFAKDVQEVCSLLQKMASSVIASSFSRFASMPNMCQLAACVDDDSDEEVHGSALVLESTAPKQLLSRQTGTPFELATPGASRSFR